MKKLIRCHDCNVKPGQFHKPGCDQERCPFCYGQLISCDCPYWFFGISSTNMAASFSAIYEMGLTEPMSRIWNWALKKKGLLAYKENPVDKLLDRTPPYKINEAYARMLQSRKNDVESFRDKLFR